MDNSSLLLFHVLPRGQRCCDYFSSLFPQHLVPLGLQICILGHDTTVMGLIALPPASTLVCSVKCVISVSMKPLLSRYLMFQDPTFKNPDSI